MGVLVKNDKAIIGEGVPIKLMDKTDFDATKPTLKSGAFYGVVDTKGTEDTLDLEYKDPVTGKFYSSGSIPSSVTAKLSKIPNAIMNAVSDIEALTDDTANNVVNAYTVKHYANRYTCWVESRVQAGTNQAVIRSNIFKDNNATYEFMFEPTVNASGDKETLVYKDCDIDTSIGQLTLTVETAPTVDIKIRIDVTTYREFLD